MRPVATILTTALFWGVSLVGGLSFLGDAMSLTATLGGLSLMLFAVALSIIATSPALKQPICLMKPVRRRALRPGTYGPTWVTCHQRCS